jgi:hypothetical protein
MANTTIKKAKIKPIEWQGKPAWGVYINRSRVVVASDKETALSSARFFSDLPQDQIEIKE